MSDTAALTDIGQMHTTVLAEGVVISGYDIEDALADIANAAGNADALAAANDVTVTDERTVVQVVDAMADITTNQGDVYFADVEDSIASLLAASSAVRGAATEVRSPLATAALTVAQANSLVTKFTALQQSTSRLTRFLRPTLN